MKPKPTHTCQTVDRDTALSRNIIRLACLYCEVLTFTPDTVDIVKIAPDAGVDMDVLYQRGYDFVRVSGRDPNRQKRELFGFYALPCEGQPERGHYDFYPIDTERYYLSVRLLRYILSDADTPESHILRGFEDWFETTILARHSDSLHTTARIPVFLPFSDWEYVPSDNPVFEQFEKDLKPEPGRGHLSIVQIWTSKLSFSQNYKLYEVITRDSRNENETFFHYQRSYFLGGWSRYDDSDRYLDIKTINGGSAVIHYIWDEGVTYGTKEFILDNDDSAVDYLRFFCWAIESSVSQFVLPLSFNNIPFLGLSPDPEEKSLPKQTSWTIEKLEHADPGYYRYKANVIYGTQYYRVTMEINKERGSVEMIDGEDTGHYIPVWIERFNGSYMTVLDIGQA